jgi:hypothetical protein
MQNMCQMGTGAHMYELPQIFCLFLPESGCQKFDQQEKI